MIIIAVQHWPATFLGLLFAGLGLSNLVAIFLGASGRAHENSVSKGVATVTTLGYLGFLTGPPLIGGLSGIPGLPGAFSVVAFFTIFIGLKGKQILRVSSKTSPLIKQADLA